MVLGTVPGGQSARGQGEMLLRGGKAAASAREFTTEASSAPSHPGGQRGHLVGHLLSQSQDDKATTGVSVGSGTFQKIPLLLPGEPDDNLKTEQPSV